MSYQVLARKWRPRNFSEVVGQQHVLTALSNGLAQNTVHHAYLFSGTRGVGKTTIARILAKSLNCVQGVTATPCGQCEHCVAIDEGRFVDLLEIDAASRTKVDDTRELLDNVQYKPAVGRYKVYLIDEVHMLSKHSFNALLKTLEEPPEYVKFLLATTDPQKLPITVLSRCLQFHLKALLPENIETQLAFILQHEKATFEHTALTVIAKAADGSMRDALSLTDQALAFGAGNIEYQPVLKMLGTIDNSHLEYLLHFIASGNVTKVFQKIEEFVSLGADFAKVHQELAGLCHQIALQQLQPLQVNGEKSAIQLLSERLNPEEVQLYYQIALQGFKDYSFAPNGKVALEMTVMRLLAFKPANYIELDETTLTNRVEQQDMATIPVTPALQPTDEVQPIEPRPVPVIAEDIEQASEKVTEFITPIAEVISTADHQQTNTSVVEPPVVEVANEIPPIEPELEIKAVNSSITEEPEQQSDPLSDVTHSRNMLRSHRLKRNESKKSLATTDLQINEPVVAADVKNNTENVQAESALKKTEPEKVAQEANNNNFDSTSNDRTQDLSALEAKLDEPHVNDHNDNNMNSYMENYSQHEMDNQANQYAEAEFEPYIPFEELQTNAPVSVEPIIPEVIRDNALPAQGSLGEHAFFSDQPFESVELDRAGYVEDKLTDPWSLAIKEMGVKGLVKLLAKNCVMSKIEKQIVLTLKPDQQHLLNNSGLCEELQLQLKNYYGTQFSMYIEVGDVEGKLTAFESEMALYEQYLDNAKRAIVEDENIKALVTNCGAKVYENSVIPL